MKKIKILLTVALLTIVASATLFADEKKVKNASIFDPVRTDSGIVVRRAATCFVCGGPMVIKTDWGSYNFLKEVDCVHKPFGTDIVYQRKGEKYYQCPSCLTKRAISDVTSQKTVCHGYY